MPQMALLRRTLARRLKRRAFSPFMLIPWTWVTSCRLRKHFSVYIEKISRKNKDSCLVHTQLTLPREVIFNLVLEVHAIQGEVIAIIGW